MAGPMIDVSIVIPTFNRLWALPKAVDSCLSSDCRAEVIVVNDGSSDYTWEWLQNRKDVVSVRSENWGKDWAVLAGVARAQGEYVRFLDSDDWLKPEVNDGQLRLARQTRADLVVAGYEDFYQERVVTEPHPWVDCDDFIAQQFGEVPFLHYSVFLFRRAFIEDIPHRQEIALRDDRMFLLEVAVRKPRIAVYRLPAFVHRHHEQGRLQATSGFRRTLAHWTNIEVYRKAIAMLAARGELSPRRRGGRPLRISGWWYGLWRGRSSRRRSPLLNGSSSSILNSFLLCARASLWATACWGLRRPSAWSACRLL